MRNGRCGGTNKTRGGNGGSRGRQRIFAWWVAGVSILLGVNLFLTLKMQADAGRMRHRIDQINGSLGQMWEKLGTEFGKADPAQENESEKGRRGVAGQTGATECPAVSFGGAICEGSYAEKWGLEQVDKPKKRGSEEVLERLRALAGENRTIAEIYENYQAFSDKMLEALANNPEMAGFVSGFPGNGSESERGLTAEECACDFPLFLQWDPRWGYEPYGQESCIGLVGCGPTCLSMALFYLTRDESLTLDRIAAYSIKNGYYVQGAGTSWALLRDLPFQYGVRVSEPGKSEQIMKYALDQGRIIICSMGPGAFTAEGHFIVIYGYDREGFLVNDPNCVARSKKTWPYLEMADQIKHIWILGGEAGAYGNLFVEML